MRDNLEGLRVRQRQAGRRRVPTNFQGSEYLGVAQEFKVYSKLVSHHVFVEIRALRSH